MPLPMKKSLRRIFGAGLSAVFLSAALPGAARSFSMLSQPVCEIPDPLMPCLQAGNLVPYEGLAHELRAIANAAARLEQKSPLGRALLENGRAGNFSYCHVPEILGEGNFDGETRLVRFSGKYPADHTDNVMAHELGHGWRATNGAVGADFEKILNISGRHALYIFDELLSRIGSVIAAFEMKQNGEDSPWRLLLMGKDRADSNAAVLFSDKYDGFIKQGMASNVAVTAAARQTLGSYLSDQHLLDIYNDIFLHREILRIVDNDIGQTQKPLSRDEFVALGRLPNGISLTEGMEIPSLGKLVGKNRLMKRAIAGIHRHPVVDLSKALELRNTTEVTMLQALRQSVKKKTAKLAIEPKLK